MTVLRGSDLKGQDVEAGSPKAVQPLYHFFREFGTFKTQEGSEKQCLQSVLFKNLLIDGTIQNTFFFKSGITIS